MNFHSNVHMNMAHVCCCVILLCQDLLLREHSSFFPPPFPSLCKVLECGWAILQKDVSAASDLDQIIEAHSQFLSDITTRCLLDLSSQVSAVGPMALRLR